MATGKTNSRFMRLLLDNVDLSGDSRQVGEFGVSYQTAPVEGWSDGVMYSTLGHVEHIFTGYQAVFNNTANTGSHTHLNTADVDQLTLAIGIRAAPAVGDPAFSTRVDQISYTVDGTDAVLVNVEFVTGAADDITYESAWGVLVADGTSLSVTTNGTSVDNGASSTNGALAFLHITASSGGTWSLKVQDSPDDAAWSDLTTFSADGSGTGWERDIIAGTIDRYIRFQATRTSGSVSAWCSVVRQ